MAKAKNDNFKSTKKKSNNKKQNVKVKMKKDNSKMYLIIGITLIVIAAVISVITFSFENTKLTCKKENNKDGVSINSHVTISKKKDKIENIEVTKTINYSFSIIKFINTRHINRTFNVNENSLFFIVTLTFLYFFCLGN